MRQINKILYILNDNTYLHCQVDAIVIEVNNEEKLRVPTNLIEQIIIFGNTTISSALLKLCNNNNITISYISVYDNFLGRFYGKTNGNIFLRKKQYDLLDTVDSINIARNIILGKVINSKNVLITASRDLTDNIRKNNILNSIDKIEKSSNDLKYVDNIDSIRGIEGNIASIYFGTFDNMLKIDDELMLFEKRSKRPPENNCNALLSLLYTLFTTTITSALESFGLDSSCGYMHTLKSGRASLSLDLIEEFRAPIVDKFVITIINKKQITSKDFENKNEGITLKERSLKKVLNLWKDYKETEINHPLYDQKIKIKMIPYIQAQLLAQTIRGDIEQYPPFKWR